jgi:hypothetical protein
MSKLELAIFNPSSIRKSFSFSTTLPQGILTRKTLSLMLISNCELQELFLEFQSVLYQIYFLYHHCFLHDKEIIVIKFLWLMWVAFPFFSS